MRHRKAGYKLGRTSSHRKATLRNLAVALFEHGQIVTTEQKAKALQPFVEKIVTIAKRGDVHSRRLITKKLGYDRRAFSWLYMAKDATDDERDAVQQLRDRAEQFFDVPESESVERNRYGELRKAPNIVKHIVENVAPRFEDRAGGYTRIIKLGRRRIGDAAEHCLIQFVGAEDGPEIGGNPSRRRRKADRRTAYAAELRKGWAGGAAATSGVEAANPAAEEAAAASDATVADSAVAEADVDRSTTPESAADAGDEAASNDGNADKQ
jgi:large subunit ribosomal protein L17